jgi:hypothetical protein
MEIGVGMRDEREKEREGRVAVDGETMTRSYELDKLNEAANSWAWRSVASRPRRR